MYIRVFFNPLLRIADAQFGDTIMLNVSLGSYNY